MGKHQHWRPLKQGVLTKQMQTHLESMQANGRTDKLRCRYCQKVTTVYANQRIPAGLRRFRVCANGHRFTTLEQYVAGDRDVADPESEQVQ